MRSAGLSQAELARRSGLAESMVSRWLRGLNQPDVPNLRRVRPVLGVPMLELLVAAGHVTLEEAQLRDAPEPPVPIRVGIPTDGLTAEQVRQVEGYAAFLRAQNEAATQAEESAMRDRGQPLRYAAFGGAKLTREQQERVRAQARRAKEEAERTGQPVVYLDEPDEPDG
jgi:transcriptional regulator with XRE-family HTH domain